MSQKVAIFVIIIGAYFIYEGVFGKKKPRLPKMDTVSKPFEMFESKAPVNPVKRNQIRNTANERYIPKQSCDHERTAFHCVEYVKNYDADTVTFNIPNVHPIIGNKVGVRLRGIDTPEVNGDLPCEREASARAKIFVESLLINAQDISLVNIGKDKYFRILADIKFDGRDLKDILIKNKLGYPYEGKTKLKVNWCNFQ